MSLKRALVLMPGLAADSVISTLSDGPTNTSYLVHRGQEMCVLRLNKPLARELGLDRDAEHDVTESVFLAGLGAEPLHYNADHGISLRRYLPGRAWNEADLQQPVKLELLAMRMRDLHALPAVGNPYEPGMAARRYALQLGTSEAREIADAANLLLADLRYTPYRECLCHNDLVAGNILEGSDGLKFIDWEYAGLGDPWFDLALVIEHHGLDDALADGFVENYLRRPARKQERERLAEWRRFYQALLSLWQLRIA
jgi:thiamine kinase-like enzyme